MDHLVVIHLRSLNFNNFIIAQTCKIVNSILQFLEKWAIDFLPFDWR